MFEREPPIIDSYKPGPRKPLVVIAKAIGVFVTVFAFGFLVLSFLRRPAAVTQTAETVTRPVAPVPREIPAIPEPTVAPETPPSASPFADLQESVIPGRYTWTSGTDEFFLVLYDDHTFMNRDGTIFPQYRWDVAPDALSIQWQRNTSRLTNIERPGVYTGRGGNGIIARLEKLPPYRPSELVPPKPAASLLLGVPCETNGLIPVVTENEELQPKRVAGLDCFQLSRQGNQRQASLHFQIAPDVKTPAFTNALVTIEYFDAELTNGGADRLSVQYDAVHGPYANTQSLPLAGANTWQEATFYLPRPVFQNHEQGGADFRIFAGRSELFVRSIKIIKNTILPEKKMPTSVPR